MFARTREWHPLCLAAVTPEADAAFRCQGRIGARERARILTPDARVRYGAFIGKQPILQAGWRGAMHPWIPAVAILVLIVGGCTPREQRELKPGAKSIILTGTVSPVQEAEVSSTVTGIVTQVVVEPARRVRPGEVVVRLDPGPFRVDVVKAEAAVAQARAGVAQARARTSDADVAEAQAEVERLRQEVARTRRLSAVPASATDYEQAGIVLENARVRLERVYALHARRLASRPEVETAQNDYAEAWRRFEAAQSEVERRSAGGDSEVRIAEARLQAAEARLSGLQTGPRRGEIEAASAQVKQAEADLARARYNLAQTTIQAPIAGIVTEVKTQVGEKVYERTVLLQIVDIDRIMIRADLSPGLLSFVKAGQPAQVTINTVPPTLVQTTIHRILPVADPKTQALGVIFVLPNPEARFQPGFTARVEIPIQRPAGSEPQKPGGSG